jgi:peptidoglycan hydrolase-like protein with peptidoglycan-binding domain
MSMIAQAAQAALAGATQVSRLLNVGAKGDDVAAVQKKLSDMGIANLKPDGGFGQKTYDAVVKFQKMLQLKADGIVGQKTAEALGLNYSGPTFGGAGAAAAAAVGAVGGVASVAGGAIGAAVGAVGSSKTHDLLVKFSHGLGERLADAAGGPTGSALAALQKKAASDVMTKIIPAIQGGRFGETAAGIANTGAGMAGSAANEIRQLKAKVVDAGANTPIVGGLFSELERTIFG